MSAPHPPRRPLLLLLPLLVISCSNLMVFFVSANSNNTGVVFELIHRHSPALKLQGNNFLGPPKSRLERIRQLLGSDNARRELLSSHGSRRRMMGRAEIAQIPIRSGADSGQGQYFVSIRFGSPHPQKFVLVTDTGSDLTWMNCHYRCRDCPKSTIHPGRVFRANDSPSFKPIPCSSDFCKVELVEYFSLAKCPFPTTPCLFDYRYLSGQRAVGIFGNETVTVGIPNHRKVRLHDVLIGCTEVFNETNGFPDGVMGLGYRKHSLVVRLAERFGNKFSYCLVDHLSPSNFRNYLSFGDIILPMETPRPKLQYTELLLGYIGSFYSVNVTGISVGNKFLNIPPQVWNVSGEGGMIVDSGTSLTLLSGPAYDAVADAFRPILSRFQKVDSTIDLPEFEFCFGINGFVDSLVPSFAIHFADGVKFEPPLKSYIIDVANGIKCLGFLRLDWPATSVLGNIMQQNHFWEFDLGRSKLGFGPSSCILSDSYPSKSKH